MKKIKSIGSLCHCVFHVFQKPHAPGGMVGRKPEICHLFFPVGGSCGRCVMLCLVQAVRGINAGVFHTARHGGHSAVSYGIHGRLYGYHGCPAFYRDREEKLRILKDSHIGAFAVICLLGYYLTYLGGISELKSDRAVLCFCLGFLLSRTLSGLSLVYFPAAKKEGLLYAFSSTAHKRCVRLVLLFLLAVCLLALLFVSPVG